MGSQETTETMTAATKHLENWLLENGYTSIETDIWQPRLADIKANGLKENILIQARVIVHPDEPVAISGTDRFALKDFAARLDRVPYAACVVIDENKNLVGEIAWERVV